MLFKISKISLVNGGFQCLILYKKTLKGPLKHHLVLNLDSGFYAISVVGWVEQKENLAAAILRNGWRKTFSVAAEKIHAEKASFERVDSKKRSNNMILQ